MSSLNRKALTQTRVSGKHPLQDEDDNASDLDSLCRDCRAVDWSNIFKSNYGCSIREFKNPICDQLLKSSCRVCRLVGHLSNPDQSPDIVPEAFRMEASPVFRHERVRSIRLSVLSPKTGVQPLEAYRQHWSFLIAHKYPNNESAQIRMLQPSQICFDFFKRKLEVCYKDHEECRYRSQAPSGLRLIDVNTKKVCSVGPGFRYIALSYVWGDYPAENLKDDFPAVVQDAMSVTKALGCQYLWVDRHCIDQDPKSLQKQSMIEQMDRIYGNAFVTIIAASGNSSRDGLPGMSGPSRRPQQNIRVGDINLVELSRVGQETVKLGKWATRGWTFQEGYLSKRRLIFTEKEVLQLCNRELVKETQAGRDVDPYDVISVSNIWQGTGSGGHSADVKNSFFWMIPTNSAISNWETTILNGIEEYSTRKLTRESDSLMALLGILKHHESIRTQFRHLWGLPLTLSTSNDVSFNLIWLKDEPTSRIQDIPSWSWSAWSGSFMFINQGGPTRGDQLMIRTTSTEEDNHGNAEDSVCSPLSRTPRIRLQHNGGTMDLHQFMQDRTMGTPWYMHPKELIIQSHVISIRPRKVQEYTSECEGSPAHWKGQKSSIVATFLVRRGVYLGTRGFFDREFDPDCHHRGLLLRHESCRPQQLWVIVLHPVRNGKYERAGLIRLFYDAENGSLSGRDGFYMDERNQPIESENQDMKGTPHDYLFLEGSKWETISLV